MGFGAVLVMVLVVIAFWIYDMRQSRNLGGPGNTPTPALVAKQLIPKGTPGSLMARREMYVQTTRPRPEVEDDAISDPAYLSGRASSVDIFPGQQFTETDFTASG